MVHIANNNFADIIHFLTIGTAHEGYTSQQKKELVACSKFFLMITRHLYKMGADEILRRYVPDFKRNSILAKAHGGAAGGNYEGKETTQKILHVWVVVAYAA